jgi:hypothetical protein
VEKNGAMADQRVIGKSGRVTGRIGPDALGEVMISIRGGAEVFNAYAADRTEPIPVGTEVVVVEYLPPRTVIVSAL